MAVSSCFVEHCLCSAARGVTLGTCQMSQITVQRVVSGRWMMWWGMEGGRADGISLPLREKRELCYGGERLMLHCVIWQQTTDSKLILFLPLGPGILMVPFPEETVRVSICLAPQSWLWGHHLFIHSFGRVTVCLCWYVSRASAFVSASRLHLGFPFRNCSPQSTGVQLSGPSSSHPTLNHCGRSEG